MGFTLLNNQLTNRWNDVHCRDSIRYLSGLSERPLSTAIAQSNQLDDNDDDRPMSGG